MRPSRRRLLVVMGTLIVLFVVATLVPFVRPRTAVPARADAIVVLSGDHGDRLPRALDLMDAGLAPTLVFDGTPDRPNEDQMCREGYRGREVVCLRPAPDSTRSEAAAAARLASQRGWRTLVVVTSTSHVVRAGLLFRRCVDGDVFVVGDRPARPWRERVRQVVREWLSTGYFLVFVRGC